MSVTVQRLGRCDERCAFFHGDMAVSERHLELEPIAQACHMFFQTPCHSGNWLKLENWPNHGVTRWHHWWSQCGKLNSITNHHSNHPQIFQKWIVTLQTRGVNPMLKLCALDPRLTCQPSSRSKKCHVYVWLVSTRWFQSKRQNNSERWHYPQIQGWPSLGVKKIRRILYPLVI